MIIKKKKGSIAKCVRVLYTENKDKTQTIVVELSDISLIENKNGLVVSITVEAEEQNTDMNNLDISSESSQLGKIYYTSIKLK